MDDLRKEFEEMMRKAEAAACDSGACDTEMDEDFPDYVIELTTKMLIPERCGIYFSKKDIRDIGLATELSISLKQRSRMLTDLLKSIFTYDDMQKIFGIIHTLIDHRLNTYQELSEAFPASKQYFDDLAKKAHRLKNSLDNILAENKE